MKKIISLFLLVATMSFGASKAVLDLEIKESVAMFEMEVDNAAKILKNAKGYLVFPEVIKAGFVIGGGYGEGVLIENNSENKSQYYSMTSASIGLQMGVQKTAYIIVFQTPATLRNFKNSNGIESSVDGSVAVSDWGTGKDISSISFEKEILVFAFNQERLMYNLNIKGTQFTKIRK